MRIRHEQRIFTWNILNISYYWEKDISIHQNMEIISSLEHIGTTSIER